MLAVNGLNKSNLIGLGECGREVLRGVSKILLWGYDVKGQRKMGLEEQEDKEGFF